MVVVFAVFSPGLRIEKIVASDEFEDLGSQHNAALGSFEILTMHAILHTSVLAPHLEPTITSGDLYCRVWISLVK